MPEHDYAWDPRYVGRQRAGLLASVGLLIIAVAIAIARPEPISFVIAFLWVALIISALLRSARTVVRVIVRPGGIEVRTVLGPPHFAAWAELSARLRRGPAGHELLITRGSGTTFAVITNRMSFFDDFVQALRARIAVNVDEDT